jgi:chromate reductase, NAD(P)H dehydrogenase (quinone)
MSGLKIIAFAGSAREGSFNKKLVKLAARGASSEGLEVTYLDFRELPLPLFDEDLEAREGLPENVWKLKSLLKDHQGFLIACPEYNSSITPLLKNAIDWASRPDGGLARGIGRPARFGSRARHSREYRGICDSRSEGNCQRARGF